MPRDIKFDNYKAYPSFVTLFTNRAGKNKYVLEWLLWTMYSSIIRNYIVLYDYIIRKKIFKFIFSIILPCVWKQVNYVEWKLSIAHTHGSWKNIAVVEKCYWKVILTVTVTFGSNGFVRYSRHVHYSGCPPLGAFTALINIVHSGKSSINI